MRTSGGWSNVVGADWRFDLSETLDVGVAGTVRHGLGGNSVAWSGGPTVGLTPFENGWLSVGWNFVGFDDSRFRGGALYPQRTLCDVAREVRPAHARAAGPEAAMKRILFLGGLLAALLQAAPAAAVCSAANTYRYSFNGSSNVAMNYANTYNYSATSTGGANLRFQRRLRRQRTHNQRRQRRRIFPPSTT